MSTHLGPLVHICVNKLSAIGLLVKERISSTLKAFWNALSFAATDLADCILKQHWILLLRETSASLVVFPAAGASDFYDHSRLNMFTLCNTLVSKCMR